MRLALHEALVQPLLLDEALHLPAVGLDEVLVGVRAEEVGELVEGLDGVVGLAEVEEEVPGPVEGEELLHAGQEHREEGGAAPYGRESASGQSYVRELAL